MRAGRHDHRPFALSTGSGGGTGGAAPPRSPSFFVCSPENYRILVPGAVLLRAEGCTAGAGADLIGMARPIFAAGAARGARLNEVGAGMPAGAAMGSARKLPNGVGPDAGAETGAGRAGGPANRPVAVPQRGERT